MYQEVQNDESLKNTPTVLANFSDSSVISGFQFGLESERTPENFIVFSPLIHFLHIIDMGSEIFLLGE